MLAALNGQAMDRFPVAVPYIMLLQTDHWCELTGQPAWTYWDWLHQYPAEHVVVYADFCRQLPFDIFQPQWAPTRQERENWEVVHQDGKHYSRDRRTGDLALLKEDLPHAFGGPNQTQYVHDQADADRHLRIRSATERLESGRYDFMCEARRAYPDTFIMNGVVGTFYQCTWAVGETRLFSMLYDDPELVHHMSQRILEDTIEDIRALAAAGCDAIYIDDAMTTRDMISRDFYERFSMPYVRPMVDEIHGLGKVAVVIYFGGVADRIAEIASLGADAISVETSMKSYVNDLGEYAAVVGDRACLWGNLDPVRVVQDGTDEELRRAIAEQVAIGRRSGRFIISTGSPITPLTPLARIQRYIALGRELGAAE